jgi:N-acetylglucosaminyldiphosphoundecaprenol N-acetyl-beta-D-mannosaminyltransferase
MVEQGKPRHIITANAEIIYKAYTEKDFHTLMDKADLVTADGAGVVLAARLMGDPVPERVTGVDLTERLLSLAEEKGWGLYFLGGSQEVVEKAVLNVLSKHTKLRIVGYHHGYYSQEETSEVVENIEEVKPDILLAALGFPKQEVFIQENIKSLQVPLSIGVGGTFDILAGTAKRAPFLMRRLGLEWLYRLLCQPSRWQRMQALPKFLIAVLWNKLRRKNI